MFVPFQGATNIPNTTKSSRQMMSAFQRYGKELVNDPRLSVLQRVMLKHSLTLDTADLLSIVKPEGDNASLFDVLFFLVTNLCSDIGLVVRLDPVTNLIDLNFSAASAPVDTAATEEDDDTHDMTSLRKHSIAATNTLKAEIDDTLKSPPHMRNKAPTMAEVLEDDQAAFVGFIDKEEFIITGSKNEHIYQPDDENTDNDDDTSDKLELPQQRKDASDRMEHQQRKDASDLDFPSWNSDNPILAMNKLPVEVNVNYTVLGNEQACSADLPVASIWHEQRKHDFSDTSNNSCRAYFENENDENGSTNHHSSENLTMAFDTDDPDNRDCNRRTIHHSTDTLLTHDFHNNDPDAHDCNRSIIQHSSDNLKSDPDDHDNYYGSINHHSNGNLTKYEHENEDDDDRTLNNNYGEDDYYYYDDNGNSVDKDYDSDDHYYHSENGGSVDISV